MYNQRRLSTELLLAVEQNSCEAVKNLLMADTPITGTRNNMTCEQIAIKNNNPKMLELLLCYAVHKNWYDVAQTLIVAGAPTTGTWQDMTCEQLALRNNSPKMVFLLHRKTEAASMLTFDDPQQNVQEIMIERRLTQRHIIISPAQTPAPEKSKSLKRPPFLSVLSFLRGKQPHAMQRTSLLPPIAPENKPRSLSHTPSSFADLNFNDSPNTTISPNPSLEPHRPSGLNQNAIEEPDSIEQTDGSFNMNV